MKTQAIVDRINARLKAQLINRINQPTYYVDVNGKLRVER